MHRSTRRGILTGMVATALLVPLTNAAPAAARSNDTSEELTRAVTLPGVLRHLLEFQKHADRNGGNRFSGLPGHTASVEYAQRVFERAGYDTTLQEFDYLASTVVGPSALEQISPNAVSLRRGRRLRRAGADRRRRRDRGGDRGRHPARCSATRRPAAARQPTSPASRPGTSRCSSAAPAHSS